MWDMLKVSYNKLSSGECSSKMLHTKPEWMLVERLVVHNKTPKAYDTYQNA